MSKVLIVDDDINICNITRKYLEKENFEVHVRFNGEDALEFLKNNSVDIAILDVMLPGIDGVKVCEEIRNNSSTPIIMLTAKGQVEDKITGLKTGADDYVVKPFDPNELVARVQTVLRRVPSTDTQKKTVAIKTDNLEFNSESFEILVDGKNISLPKRELQLLEFLLKHPNKVFSRDQLIESIWGWDFEGEDRAVDLYIQRLRKRIKTQGKSNWSIKTIWGIGYKFEVIQ